VGNAVGPDLGTVVDRPPDQLLGDILIPSRAVTAGFSAYLIETQDGETLTGVIANETATSITLRQKEGVEKTILRSQIQSITASTLSMMPEDLEKTINPQQMADLITYLKKPK
jgi:putative heme-binding domain-containing protein